MTAAGRRAVGLPLLLPLIGLLLAGIWSWIDVTAQLRATLRRDAALLRAQTEQTLDTQESVLVAVDMATANLSWPQIRGSEAVHRLLVRLADTAGAVDTLGMIDPQGRIAAASDMPFPARPIDLSDRDFATAFPPGSQAAVGFVGRAVLSRVDGRPQVHLARPRRPGAGVAGDGGVIVAGFRPALFEGLFARLGQDGAARPAGVLLMRQDGCLLARFPEAVTPGHMQPLLPDDPVRVAARGLSGSETVEFGRHGFSAVQRIGRYGLILAARFDPAVARNEWLRQMPFPTAGALATAALLLLLGLRAQARIDAEAERASLLAARIEQERAAAQERAQLEARLRQTEKQASLGQLAAGVAHDFNNLLQAVVTAAHSVRQPGATTDSIARSAGLILRAAERGAALTRRMLDFSRADEAGDSAPATAHFAPEAALRGAQDLLAAVLGAKWPVRVRLPGRPLPAVRGSQAECEAVLLNLAGNARDAMPGGGEVELAAALADPPQALADGRPDTQAPLWVRITVRDRGHGMDPATLARAGEAFFTTKPRGAGTGLGLSMARGFAQRGGGVLDIASVPEQGTMVTLWLPAG